MKVTDDASKISKTVLTFILIFFKETFLPTFQYFLLKRMLLVSHKMVFIENEASLLCVTMGECSRAFADIV